MIIEEFQKTGNKNLFEEVIDRMMLENFDEKFKEKIMGMSKSEKRMAILSLLDKDRNLFMKIRSLVTGNRVSKTEHLKDVILFLREYVKIEPGERKKLGQVFTPLDLAKDMMNLVDKYDEEFWKNPNHKVLDSSAGFGTFLVLAAYKFMNGLQEWEPDDDKRFRWIVENCLYYGDIDPKSVFLWLCLIDPYDEYKTNTYWGSYLNEDFDKHAKEVWGVEKWDAIIQNPPYQKSADVNNAATDKPIWHLFVDKSLEILSENGKMVMVHPSGWRSVKTFINTKRNLIEKNIRFIKMHSFKDGQDMFNAAINFDYYFVENNKYSGTTEIICEDKTSVNIDISKIEILPSENIEEISSLFAKDGEEKVQLISNSSYHTQRDFMSKEKSITNIYPCVYTVRTNHLPTIRWSSVNNRGHFNIPKLIFARGASGTICDINGEYGLTEFAYGLVDNRNDLEKIKTVLDSEYFIKRIMLFKNSLGDRYNRKMISQFRKDFWKEFIK